MIPAVLLGGDLETLSERVSLAAIFVYLFAVNYKSLRGLLEDMIFKDVPRFLLIREFFF